MVHSIYDSTTESLIQKTIEGIQGMISIHNKNQGEGEKEKGIRTKEEVIEISLASKRHGELQIRTLQEAPRDPDKLRKILKEKQEEYEKADDSEDIERLVPEIEMLKFVQFLVSRRKKGAFGLENWFFFFIYDIDCDFALCLCYGCSG